jgi:hypothetical protein
LRTSGRILRAGSWLLAGLWKRLADDVSARQYSNALLRRYADSLSGDIVNVSGWVDSDKHGGTYRTYFGRVDSYTVTNIGGQRGMPDDRDPDISWLYLDIEQPVGEEFRGRFDVVLCHTVLEHIFDFATALENLARLSRDVVIVVVPFAQDVHYSDSYGDYVRLTPHYLERFFSEHGFSTLLSDSNDQPFTTVYVTFVASKHPERHPEFSSAPRRYDSTLTVGRFGRVKESGLDNADRTRADRSRAMLVNDRRRLG